MSRNNGDSNRFSKGQNFKEKLLKSGEKFKYLLQKTAIETAIFAVLGTGLSTYLGSKSELERNKRMPLAFSEIGAVEKEAKKNNINVGELTEYEMKVNDMCMKIFEAYNEAHEGSYSYNQTEIFASNLYNAMDLKHIYKYNLKNLLVQVPTYIPQINSKLITYKMIGNNLNVINTNMDKSWDESHIDNYHTEMRTRTYTDSKGKTKTETYFVQVYDNTTHDYEYNKEQGEIGAKNLNNLFIEIPAVKLEEKILKTNVTSADGEYATEKSRNEYKLTQQQLLDIANTWYTGSTILNNINDIDSLYPKLKKSSISWNEAKNTAHSETYKTTSHSDAGPEEFQIAKNTLELGTQINNDIQEMLQVIETTGVKVPLLEKKIKEFIEIGYAKINPSDKDADDLADEIMVLTKEIYQINFKKGIDVDRFRWSMIFLYVLMGMVLGGGVGAGINALDNKIHLYDKIFRKKS